MTVAAAFKLAGAAIRALSISGDCANAPAEIARVPKTIGIMRFIVISPSVA
jgi:hypothetical protein